MSFTAPWTLSNTLILPSPPPPQTAGWLFVVDAKVRGTFLLYKSKGFNPVDNVPSVLRVPFVARRTHLRSHFAVGVVWEVVLLHGMQRKHTTTRINTSVNQITLVACGNK